ncbi:MAG: hypothetical protein HW414_1188 [Dehalococcoidia bacterium]|nr:hypothetical protein [Dehalococcoidia bacterium]
MAGDNGIEEMRHLPEAGQHPGADIAGPRRSAFPLSG